MATEPDDTGTGISLDIENIDQEQAQEAIGVALDNMGGIGDDPSTAVPGAEETSVAVSGAGAGMEEQVALNMDGAEESTNVISAAPVATRQPIAPVAAQPAAGGVAPKQKGETEAEAAQAKRETIAAGITVSPEMLEAFKAENPFFRQMDDATATAALKDVIAQAVLDEEKTQKDQRPAYSLWNDIKSIPGAIGAGAAKSGFESFDAVNEVALGNDPSQWSDTRAGIERYYANTRGISGAAAVITQWGAAFVGIGKFAKLAKVPGLAKTATTKGGRLAQAATVGAAADYMAFDGLEGRLSDVVQAYPALENPVTEFLATKPGDTQAEGRLKNALEGLGIGATVDVVMSAFKAYRAHRVGDKASVEQAIDEGTAKFDELNAEPKAEAPAAPAQPTTPAAPPAGDTTGLVNMGGEMGKGMGDAIRDGLWDKTLKGDITEAGQPSAVLQAAKMLRDRGALQTREAFDAFASDYGAINSQGTPQFQADMRALVEKHAGQQQAPAAGVADESQAPGLRAANDDPEATGAAFSESPSPQARTIEEPIPDNDTVKMIDEALMAPSVDRAALEDAAKRMAQRVATDPAAPIITPEIGQATPTTFDSLTQADDLRAIVDATEKEILAGIEGSASSRGPVSITESQRLAKEFAEMTGQDQGHFYVRMAGDAGSIENLHARLLAYDQVTRQLAVEVRDMAHAIKKGEPGTYGSIDELKDAFENKLAAYAQVQDWLKGVRSETGRTLAIMRHSQRLGQSIDLSGISPLGQGRGPLGGNVTIDELADAVTMAGTDRKMLGQIANPTRYARVRDALISLYIKNILSGPTTQLVNIIGNLSSTLAHPAQKIIGGAASRDTLIMREGVKQYGYMLAESGHALKMAFEAYKRGQNILDPSRSKFTADGKFPEALTASNISGGMVPDDSVTGYLANGVFKAIDAVSTRALSASDEFFKQTMYASELTARAWADGVAQGLKGDQLKAYVKAQRDAAFTSAPDIGSHTAVADNKAAEAALEVARFTTFTQNVKPGGVASSILYMTNRYPELKFAVPFVRVIANLLDYTGSMTPGIASHMTAYKDAIKRGGRDAAVAKGRLAMGYALWTTAIGLAASGQLTGAGPTKSDGSPDYKKRQMLAQSGWKPNALKIGNTYIDLSRMDPFGLPFNIAAQAYEKFQGGMRDEKDWLDITGSMAFTLGHVMLDRQYMKGLADLFEAMNDDTGSKATAYVANITSSIAVPNFVRQTMTVQNDPLMREARGFVETIMRRTPFASENLAARRMPWGEKMELQPSLYGVAPDDPLMAEYARLLQTGESGAGEPLPRMKTVPGSKSIDMASFRLSNGELLYDAYGDLINQPDPSVQPLKEVLKGLIESPEYKNEMIDGAASFKGTRLKAWQTIMARYRAAAWRKVLETYPEVRERFYEKKQSTAEAAAAQKQAVEMEAFLNE